MAELDLTPSPVADQRRSRRRIINLVIVFAVVSVLGVLVFQALTSARVFFYNVDEAIELQDNLGQDRFRMQGTVTTEPELRQDGSLVFSLAFGGQSTDVRHVGDAPSALFECNSPVVVEGRWVADEFESDIITVKHSEEYEEANPERLDYDETRAPGSGC